MGSSIGGEAFYRIANHDAMPPFLMSMVSDSNHWIFLSNNGALAAGRGDPDPRAVPSQTHDGLHEEQAQVGGKTVLRVRWGSRVQSAAFPAIRGTLRDHPTSPRASTATGWRS